MALHEHGIRVPQDMSVVTVHDGPIAEAMFPPLTTVRMPVEQMGYDGVVGLIELIRGERKVVDATLAPLELVGKPARKSTRRTSRFSSKPATRICRCSTSITSMSAPTSATR